MNKNYFAFMSGKLTREQLETGVDFDDILSDVDLLERDERLELEEQLEFDDYLQREAKLGKK